MCDMQYFMLISLCWSVYRFSYILVNLSNLRLWLLFKHICFSSSLVYIWAGTGTPEGLRWSFRFLFFFLNRYIVWRMKYSNLCQWCPLVPGNPNNMDSCIYASFLTSKSVNDWQHLTKHLPKELVLLQSVKIYMRYCVSIVIIWTYVVWFYFLFYLTIP